MWTSTFLALCLSIQAAPSQFKPIDAPTPDTVVAKVGSREIKASEVASHLWEWRGAEVLGEVIDAQVIADAARTRGVSVTEKEVEERMSAYLEDLKKQMPPESDLEAYIVAQGYPRSRLYVRTRNELLINKMALAEFNPNDYVKVSTIVIPLKSQSAADLKVALDSAQEVYNRLSKGEAWDAVLNSVISDPQIQRTRGLLGWRQISAFPAPAQTELKNLKVGEVTKPVQTQNGLQVFRIDAKSDALKGEDLEEVRQLFLQQARGNFMAKLRAAAKIERVWRPSR